MRPVSKKINGDWTVTESIDFTGMVTGSMTVLGGEVSLMGMVCKDLLVKSGAKVVVRGTVQGTVYCEGRVEVLGVVGKVVSPDPKNVYIHPRARVKSI